MTAAATRRRVGIASSLVVAIVAGLLVWLATTSQGEVVRKADLNDGGVWVTSTVDSRYGRVNKPAAQLDLGVLDGRDALLALVTQGSLQAAIFRTDDLDETFEKVRASGAEVLQEPVSQPWGSRDCAFRDPSGNLVRISQA